jgi:hypothetical protein
MPRRIKCRSFPAPARDERGEHDNIVNAPLRAGNDGEIFREAMEKRLLPRIGAFRPDLIVISAGFDAHHLDPLGGLNLVEADFAWAALQTAKGGTSCPFFRSSEFFASETSTIASLSSRSAFSKPKWLFSMAACVMDA